MSKNLVIVESPAKAKTIEKYLGGDFTVLSSVGHIRSIPKKVRGGAEPIDIPNGFKTTYEVDPEKRKVVSELKKQVKAVGKTNVWLATDEDREGEAIAWHLTEVLGLDPKTTKRIVFHEITKDAITTAVKHPRTVDMHLVEAQQARQILDRIVGFELSPVVWQKVPGGKSAGRVQSPAVRLLVEREKEIQGFAGSSEFRVTALFHHDGQEFKAELGERFTSEDDAHAFLESLIDATYTISDISKSPSTRNPAAPFTTSTLQQAANSRLGFSSKATMAAAQKLYQAGKITYMRTDSVNLSGQAIAAATDYIKRLYGPEYSTVRKFKTKSAGAQEAHEAIRPTDMSLETASNNEYDQKLYDLIRRRTLASQMSPAKLENTIVTIEITPAEGRTPLVFTAKGQVITFDGFLRVYGASKEEILPPLKSHDTVAASEITARQMFAKPPARYTEGSLVKKLEELGIGRPSTYATIIDTIQTRGYVVKGESEGTPRDVIVLSLGNDGVERDIENEKTGSDRGKLVPTPSGELIAGFLSDYFEQVVDYDFTANVETELDQIAANKLARNTMLSEFYTPFHGLIEKSGDIDRSKVGANREVGTDPKTGKPIYARFGRFGPMLQLGSQDSDERPQFAPLPRGTKIETVTLEQALHAFTLPRLVGQTEDGQDIKANIGRFGPYIQVGKLFVSIKPEDPHDISLEKARELYLEKLRKEAEKYIATFDDGIQILNGRYGPYITDGKKNVKVPKDDDPKTITHEQAKKLLEAAPTKRSKTRKPRSRTTKKK
ncbi:MAG TPA: type I DNA topoisomerase [Candidatus Saccharimonadaceae bacterium]|nr:type I DNA topoisomerase [Candidatus Saccharimonadaceae bacterium]